MAAETVNIRGLAEFRAALRDLGGNWESELSLAHQKLGSKAAGWARARARAMGGVQARAASAIGERHSAKSAAIAVLPARGLDAMANVAFWGAKKHTGWYAAHRYWNSSPQHPPWVGASWEAAVAGQGPYAINDALAAHLDDIVEEYGDMIDHIARRAFPER